MKSYDDLQRFKEKTQTNHIEFKGMSEQSFNSDTTNWAVIRQLLNEGAGSILDNSQRIDRAAPQPVDPAAFTPSSAENVRATSPLSMQSFVPATPGASDRVGASLLDSISASLQHAAAVEPTPVTIPPAEATPLRAMPVAEQTAVSVNSLLAQLAASNAPAPQPAAASEQPGSVQVSAAPPQPVAAQPLIPAPSPAVEAPAKVSYKQLFSTATAPGYAALPKDMLLHPLLEKIASCR